MRYLQRLHNSVTAYYQNGRSVRDNQTVINDVYLSDRVARGEIGSVFIGNNEVYTWCVGIIDGSQKRT